MVSVSVKDFLMFPDLFPDFFQAFIFLNGSRMGARIAEGIGDGGHIALVYVKGLEEIKAAPAGVLEVIPDGDFGGGRLLGEVGVERARFWSPPVHQVTANPQHINLFGYADVAWRLFQKRE
jgi:hypothetical protein